MQKQKKGIINKRESGVDGVLNASGGLDIPLPGWKEGGENWLEGNVKKRLVCSNLICYRALNLMNEKNVFGGGAGGRERSRISFSLGYGGEKGTAVQGTNSSVTREGDADQTAGDT